MVDKALCNILLLSFGFFCTCTAYVSVFNAQKYVIESIKNEDPTYKADSYIALCITYACFAIFIWVAPPIIRSIGPRPTLIIGNILNIVYIAQFLYPIGWVLYFSSIISGMVGALVWNAQGYFLTENSTERTIARNSSILWAIMQSGNIFGNVYILLTIRKNSVNQHDRYLLFGFMTGMVVLSVVFMASLRRAPHTTEAKLSPVKIFLNTIHLLFTFDMLLLAVTFFYVGIETSFFIGVYSSALGFMKVFDVNDTILITVSGILIGVGEVLGGIIFGILSSRYAATWRHFVVVTIGFLVHVSAFVVVMLTIPNSAANGPTAEEAYLDSSLSLALFCSLLLGFGDCCYLTQIYGFLGKKYKNESTEAFALLKFVQTGATAAAFFYTPIGLVKVLSVLFAFAFLGTVTFIIADLRFRIRVPAIIKSENSEEVLSYTRPQITPVPSSFM